MKLNKQRILEIAAFVVANLVGLLPIVGVVSLGWIVSSWAAASHGAITALASLAIFGSLTLWAFSLGFVLFAYVGTFLSLWLTDDE